MENEVISDINAVYNAAVRQDERGAVRMGSYADGRHATESERVNVKIAKVYSNAKVPEYQSSGAAGFDVHAYVGFTETDSQKVSEYTTKRTFEQKVIVGVGERRLIGTGLRFQVPQGYELQLRPRSGLALKKGISLTNSPATIDADYTGEVKVIIENRGHEPFIVEHNDRICQGVINKVPQANFEVVEELDETERGSGGFGSSGVKG